MEERMVLDRIEDGRWAVLATGSEAKVISVPASWLPRTAREGDVLALSPLREGGVSITVDEEATKAAREEIRSLRDSLPQGPSGDLEI